MNKNIKNALGRARISTLKQSSGASLDEQVKSIEYFAKQKGYNLLEVEKEVYTGTKQSPGYRRHIEYIESNPGLIDYYIVYDIDRLTRAGLLPYQQIKEELSSLGVALVDTKEIIKEQKNLQEISDLGFEYEWSKESPGEVTEAVLVMQAQSERKKILQRTITKQIQYTQNGYKVRGSLDGYRNERILIGTQIRYVSVPDKHRANLFVKMFELRAEQKLTDEEIVKVLNDTYGYKSKTFNRWSGTKGDRKIIGVGGGKKLTVKQLQRIITRPGYAGILCEKWTHNKPIKAQWDGLVSIDLFNRANRGKVFIKENGDGTFELLHDYKLKEPKIRQRNRYREEFPFKIFKCPRCKKQLLAAFSQGKLGKKYGYYYCSKGHKQYSVPSKKLEEQVYEFLSELQYSQTYFDVIEEVLKKRFEDKKKELEKEKSMLNRNLEILEDNKKQITEKLLYNNNPATQQIIEEELLKKNVELENAKKNNFMINLQEGDIEDLLDFGKKIVETPEKTLIDKVNPLRQRMLMKLVFKKFPTHEEFLSRTHELTFVFNGFKGKSTTESDALSHQGWLLGIEPRSAEPQPAVLTVTP